MKKILSLVLVACMLFSSLVLLSSCGKAISVKDFEENPTEALAEVMSNSPMLADELGIGEIIAASGNGGSVSIVFESDTLMGDITSISETIYMNGKDKQFVSDTAVKYAGQDLAARIFVDKSGLIINSESLLGSNKSVEINLATLAEKFTSSTLAQMMGMPDEAKAEVEQALGLVKDMYEKYFTMFDDMQGKTAELTERVFEALEPTFTEGTVTVDGKDVKCVIVTYTFNNKTIEAYMDICMDFYMDMYGDMIEGLENFADADMDTIMSELNSQIDSAMAEMNEAVDIDLKLNMNIDVKTATIKSETLKGKIVIKEVDEGEDGTINLDCEMLFGDDRITVGAVATHGEESFNVNAAVTKTVKDGTDTYNATASYKLVEDGETEEGKVADITYTYNNSDGAFKLEGTIGPEDDSVEFGLEGTMKVEKDSFALKITSATADAVTVKFNLSITFNKNAEIPARPSDAVDVVEMTEGNWVDLITEIQNGPLGALLAG